MLRLSRLGAITPSRQISSGNDPVNARIKLDMQPLESAAAPTYRGGLGAARVRHVTEFIRAGLERDLTLVHLAQAVGLSTAHFAVMFRQSTGETPHRFVLRCRIERAKEMLRTEKARIVDVAVACGFKTQQHFARVFRQMCGATPHEYRKDFIV